MIQDILDTVLYGNVTVYTVMFAGVILLAAAIIAKSIGMYVRRSIKDNVEVHKLRLILKLINYIIMLFALIIILPMLGFNPSGLLVAGGIVALVLAFAAQSLVSNLISGIFLFFERPVKISDAVEINGNAGIVEDIGLLSTTVRKWDGYTVRVPNNTVFTTDIINYMNTAARRFEYVVGIRYKDDADKAVEIIDELVEKEPLVLKNPAHQAFVDNLGDNSVNIVIRLWAPPTEWYGVKMAVLWKIKAELEKNGIQVPFPQRTVWFPEGVKMEGGGPKTTSEEG